ncbi:clumping factor A-like [Hibiscus syriacus]|uniref:clumping factor A-like n=1 Tax=Hibiscus syriacus TaxID=106335 RepID=UPI00192106A9|nr:clumping factor A-like [Hibiscus syriacus]
MSPDWKSTSTHCRNHSLELDSLYPSTPISKTNLAQHELLLTQQGSGGLVRSPEDNRNEATTLEENLGQALAPASLSVEKVSHDEMEEHTHLYPKLGEESNALEQTDIQQHSPNLGGERKASDNSEGPANSTSDSGSDSDSDNDSSDSGSHNRGASPAASGSGSSSDSESDASSNSKEGSDEDVDIMTSDDDKETKQDIPTSEPGLLTSPVTWQAEHDRSLQNGMDENHDDDGSDAVDIEGNGSDAVDIEQDLPEDEQEIEMAANTNKECEKHEEGTKPSSSDHDEFQGCQNFIGNLFDDTENMVTDNIRNEQSDYSVKSKGKSKRGSDSKHIYEKSKHSKRLKFESISQSLVSGSRDAELFGSSRPIEEPYQSSNKGDKDYADSQKGYNQVFPRKSSTYFHQSCRKSSDPAAWTKAGNTAERPLKHTESSIPGSKFTAKNVHEGYVIQKDNPSRDTQNEDGLMKGKNSLTNPKSGARGKDAVPSDFQHMKHGETVGKSKDSGHISGSYINYSLKDNNRVSEDRYPTNGKSNVLQRELSHLELGEIREPLIGETPTKKQFES